jgi:hypothetical protein
LSASPSDDGGAADGSKDMDAARTGRRGYLCENHERPRMLTCDRWRNIRGGCGMWHSWSMASSRLQAMLPNAD